MVRTDPIHDRYYVAVERLEALTGVLFYATAALSLLSFGLEKVHYPTLREWVDIAFLMAALVLCVLDASTTLYFYPRAEDARRDEFFSQAFGVPLTHEKTSGYYNNDEQQPIRRMAAQTLENTFFSGRVAAAMLTKTRAIVAGYFLVWLILVFQRDISVGLITISAQILFSEHILVHWLRLEWVCARSERIYSRLYDLLRQSGRGKDFDARAIRDMTLYETTKATGSVALSDATFTKLNASLTVEWEQIKRTLGL